MITPVLTDAQLEAIGRELLEKAAYSGDPRHPNLHAQIDRAAFIAANSATFRSLIDRLIRNIST